ncbi:VanZ family protein [Salinisphaera sp. Q1T1-3]|uniref:VanZ family protein n=1 Tax=Salinisphaera sp. Q1T1-3 TaxID=2321229 RepID=UPI0011C3ACB9|nr:VanZ family protein [Salinisphaera sp. Q1T1-3]
MPSPPSEPQIPYFDKLEHAFAFTVMAAWFGTLFAGRNGLVLLALSAFGVLTEVMQWASGYRDGDPLDWMADTFGILIGLVLVRAGAMRWLVYLDRRVATARN